VSVLVTPEEMMMLNGRSFVAWTPAMDPDAGHGIGRSSRMPSQSA
jgi:hypothetical protein